MPSITIEQAMGRSKARTTLTGDDLIDTDITLPAGKAGTLSTRTDNDTGVCTVSSGHGILDTDTVDVYWSGGRRYGCDVTAVGATTVSIDLGAGDNLPTQATAVVVCKQVVFNRSIDGDNLVGLSIQYDVEQRNDSGFGCRVSLMDATADVIAAHDFAANKGFFYEKAVFDEIPITNPYTGDPITNGVASNGDGTYAAILRFQGIQDVTP